ncbi:MAG TPA: crosslink repair DNA glycosylase YcaQ family protein [Actinomycetota bacterium]
MLERVRAWTYARQRLGRPARGALEALRAVVAVYATHPTAPLALRARTRSLTGTAYRRLDRERRGLRIPGMRGTVFLVPREAAARIFTAVRPPRSKVVARLKRHDMSEEEYEAIARRVVAVAGEPARAEDLREATGLEGPVLATILRGLRLEGRLLALAGEPLTSSPHRYVATEAWAEDGLDAGDREEALAWLAGAYLEAYGPARVEDFAWWAGVGKRASAAAVAEHDTIDAGEGLLLPARHEAAFERTRRLKGTLALLPRWDAYTMGHAPDGRARFVHPDVQQRVYEPIGVGLPGDGNPVVLVDGEVVATWTYSLKDGAEVQPFDTLGPRTRGRIEGEVDAIAALLAT